ncbi:MAG: hypothetical protein Q9M34_00760, partial [Sulfurimonas sp.]|nr:hypothetical protein [Sulfurimonas sp.]
MKFVIMMFILLIFFSLAGAEEKKYQLTQATYEGISKVQKLLDKNNYEKAETILLELEKSRDIRKKLDKAYIRFYIGYFYTLVKQEQKALKYFKEAISYKALAPSQVSNAYLNIIQIVMELEQYKQALFYTDELIKTSQKPKSEYYVTKANIEMILKDYDEVIVDINMAIKIDKKSKPSWLKIKYYSFYMLKDYKNAIKMLKKLITLDPQNKEYWIQLSSLYSVTDKFDNALVSLDIANIAHLGLSEKELLRLISWLQYNNIPYKAALIMQENINLNNIHSSEKNLNLLGDLYYEARSYDKAIHWYKKSAKLNKSSKTYFKIAKIYANQ